MADAGADDRFIASGDQVEQPILPDLAPTAEHERGQHRNEGEAEQERAEQGEAHRQGHRREQAPLDALEGQQWNIRDDDDQERKQDGALDDERRLPDPSGQPDGIQSSRFVRQGSDDALDHDDGGIHEDAEVERADAEQAHGHARQMHAEECEQ